MASMDWVAYLTLAASTVFALLRPDRQPGERLLTLVLVIVATVWVYVMFTRVPEPRRERRRRMVVYFVGLLVLATLLMARNPMFFIFAISAFFHAGLLRPMALIVAGVAATSILINTTITGFPWPTADLWFLYGTIIVIQIIAIGGGTIISERLSELTEERRQTVARLEAAMDENVGLQRQLVTQAREAGVLDERARMAREIHDTIAHGLTGIVTQLEAAEQATDRPEARQRHIANAIRLARESLSEARRSVEASRPEALEGVSLEEALTDVAQRWSALSGVPVDVTTTGEPVPLHPEIEVALLRTAQEALANVAKHATASRARLTLSYMGDEVTLDVRDDGVGFEVPTGARQGRAKGLRADRDAPAGQPGRGHAGDRIRAGRRHGDLGTGARHRRPAGGVRVVSPIRLLIVDDHPVVRDGLRGIFEGDPEFEVLGEAADGAEAVAMAESLHPDVVLMDLRMPMSTARRRSGRWPSAPTLPGSSCSRRTRPTPTSYRPSKRARSATCSRIRRAPSCTGRSVLPTWASRCWPRPWRSGSSEQIRTPAQDGLSERELEVLSLIAQGETNRGTAARLFISEATVKTHLLHIYAKLDVNDRAAAVATAYERGLLGPGRG